MNDYIPAMAEGYAECRMWHRATELRQLPSGTDHSFPRGARLVEPDHHVSNAGVAGDTA